MGKSIVAGVERARTVKEATLGAANQATEWGEFIGFYNIILTGTFVGTVVVDRSFDGGATSAPCTALAAPVEFTTPATEVLQEPEPGVLIRLRCSAYTSGSIAARVSQ